MAASVIRPTPRVRRVAFSLSVARGPTGLPGRLARRLTPAPPRGGCAVEADNRSAGERMTRWCRELRSERSPAGILPGVVGEQPPFVLPLREGEEDQRRAEHHRDDPGRVGPLVALEERGRCRC